jgi:hypothetical protein
MRPWRTSEAESGGTGDNEYGEQEITEKTEKKMSILSVFARSCSVVSVTSCSDPF